MLQPVMTIDDQRMVRPEEVRRRLGISERTFYTYAQKGILPTVKVGGGLRVKESDLRQILEAGLPLRQAV
jgi:excisionase family DNA binding protein